jgi:hypothetical protein
LAIVPAEATTRPEPLGQQPGGEPVIAVTVRDEDVDDVAPLRGDPVAEQARLICRHRGVVQHRVLAAVGQRARLGEDRFGSPFGRTPSCGGASLTKTS